MTNFRLAVVGAAFASCIACSDFAHSLPANNVGAAPDDVQPAHLKLYWTPDTVSLTDWNSKRTVLLFSPSLSGSISIVNRCSQGFILLTPLGYGKYKKLDDGTWSVTGYAHGPYSCSVVASYKSLNATLTIVLKK
jgi:hypothetical protein